MSSAAAKIALYAIGILAQHRCQGVARSSARLRGFFRARAVRRQGVRLATHWLLDRGAHRAGDLGCSWSALPYPYASDILFVLPFLIDTIGNALDLYDTIDWWDDANHFVNWALLSGALAAALARTHIRGVELFGLVVGFGGVTAILWEIGEYFAFIRNSSELTTAYTDTLGDMALGLSGSTLTADDRRSRTA